MFPSFYPPKAGECSRSGARCCPWPRFKKGGTPRFPPGADSRAGDQAVVPHRDPKSQESPVAQQLEQRVCHPGLPAVRSRVSGRFGAVPAPPDASRCRSQPRHKVHGLRQGVGDKCPQGSGGVTATSLCLCHRDLAVGTGVPPGCRGSGMCGCSGLGGAASARLDPAGISTAGDRIGHGGGPAGVRRMEHGWMSPGRPGAAMNAPHLRL